MVGHVHVSPRRLSWQWLSGARRLTLSRLDDCLDHRVHDLLMVCGDVLVLEPISRPAAAAPAWPAKTHQNRLEQPRVRFAPGGVRQPDWQGEL